MMQRISGWVQGWVGRAAKPTAAGLQQIAELKPITVVTGASRGIGRALARRYAQAGHDIAVVARGADKLTIAARELERDYGVTVVAIALDITAKDAPDTISKAIRARGFYMDILINNAAVGLAGPMIEQTNDDQQAMLALNVAALTRMTRYAAPRMRDRGRGGILNIASLGGFIPGPNQAAYYASKAYVISLTRALASEMSGLGVRFTVVAPGPVRTAFHADMGAEHSPYRYLIPPMSAKRIASSAYVGFGLGRRLVVPGLINNVLALSTKVIPHALLIPIVGLLLAFATRVKHSVRERRLRSM